MANYKRLFLAGYSYYLTIVTYQRRAILIENIELLREAFRESKRYYRYTIDSIVILPDHIHMIITPENHLEYPKIIHAIKYNFSKRYTERDEKDYWRCLEYIRINPVKHEYIESGMEWKYMSHNLTKEKSLVENEYYFSL